MKRILLLFSIIFGNAAYADELKGLLTQVLNSGSLIAYQHPPYIITSATYTPGGLTFTFPTGFFPQDPYVFVGLVHKGTPGIISRYTYSAYNKSVNGITIRVYNALGLEIGSNQVEVQLFAVGQDPNGDSILVN